MADASLQACRILDKSVASWCTLAKACCRKGVLRQGTNTEERAAVTLKRRKRDDDSDDDTFFDRTGAVERKRAV